MNYDLSIKSERDKFIKRANILLKNNRTFVTLSDNSHRTINQNSYIHVLCRILAFETGETEEYAKTIYFKQLCNPHIFCITRRDKITNKLYPIIRSCSDLSIREMQIAISNLLHWAAEHGYYLPEASIDKNGDIEFKSEKDKAAFHQAQIRLSKEQLINS